MADNKIILTVRATQDGYYANYYYKGPITSDEGYFPGEVFQVDATPYQVKDNKGNPVFALDEEGNRIPVNDAKGKQLIDEKGKKVWKMKMATFFSPVWMERVADDTEVTYPDRPKWTIPEAYRIKKVKPVKAIPLPDELRDIGGLPVPESVEQANAIAIPSELEGVI